MSTFFAQKIVILVLINYATCLIRDKWVDPHSMDKKPYVNRPDNSPSVRCEKGPDPNNSDIYFKRIVRLILKNAYLEKDDAMKEYSGHINLKFTKEHYDMLTDFATNINSKENTRESIFREVNAIFETALKKTTFDIYKETIISLQDELFYMIFNRTSGALAGATLTLYVTYKLIRAKFTWRSIIQYFLFLGYVFDFVVCYLKILQQEEVDQIVTIKTLGSIPPECDPNKMSWWAYFKSQIQSSFYESHCRQFYAATHPNFRMFVQPLKIFNLQFKQLVVEPISQLGEAFGKFGRSMFTSLPWGLNLVLYPIVLVSTIVILMIIMIFIRGEPFKMRVFHFISFEWGERRRRELPRIDQQQRRRLPYDHRELIEDVASNNDTSPISQSSAPTSCQSPEATTISTVESPRSIDCYSPGSSHESPQSSSKAKPIAKYSTVSTNTSHQITDTDLSFESRSGANEDSFDYCNTSKKDR